jgi:hypothetical protein
MYRIVKLIKRIWYGQRKEPEVIIHKSGTTIYPEVKCKDFNEWANEIFFKSKKQTT